MSLTRKDAQKLDEFFNKITLAEVVKGKPDIVSVETTTTVEDTLKILNSKKILSVPVLDKKSNEYVGIISISDIVVAVCFNPCFTSLTNGGMKSISQEEMGKVLEKSIFKNSVADLLGITEEGKTLWVFDEKENLNKIAEYMSCGVHRALITREGKKPCYLTQSDVTKCIAFKLKEDADVKALLAIPLSKLGHVKEGKKVVSVKTNETALAGFRRLLQWRSFRDWNLASLPVVDEKKGSVVGNLSESDLRGMNEDRLLDLCFSVTEYLTTFYGEMRAPVTVTAETTFVEALEKVVSEKVHRAWIVDKNGQPVGTFSLSDVIAQFTVYPWEHTAAEKEIYEDLWITSG